MGSNRHRAAIGIALAAIWAFFSAAFAPGSAGLFSSSPSPDPGSIMAALGSIASPSSPDVSSGGSPSSFGGGFGGGGGGGGGGGAGGGF